MLIQNHALDTRPVVIHVLHVVLERLHGTFSIAIISQDDKVERDQLQGLLCSAIQVITRGVDKEIVQFSDHIITLLLQVLNNQNAIASEEGMMTLGAVASTIDQDFEKYLAGLFPFLVKSLRNYSEWQICFAAVGTWGDICRALELKVLPYCDEVVCCLLEDLQNPALNRQVKPAVLSCFGDIALAIGGNFVKYLPPTLQMLDQAARTKVSEDDEELTEYLSILHEGILEAYIGITQGLNDGCNSGVLLPQLANIFQFLEEVVTEENMEESTSKNCIGLIGDLAVAFLHHAADAAPFFQQKFVDDLLSGGQRIEGIREVALWARSKRDELVLRL
jgi:importin subunit beta-1